jgi:GntR family transcriptional regulator
MAGNANAFFAEPITAAPGGLLRVAAYARIADAIHAGVFPPRSLLPTEHELSSLLGVSRTVVREALMLLAEDGLVVSRRGVGRFVTEGRTRPGFERLRPLEEQLATSPGDEITVVPQSAFLVPSSPSYIGPGLDLADGEPVLAAESVIYRSNEAIAVVQENLPYSTTRSPALHSAVEELVKDTLQEATPKRTGTLLRFIRDKFGDELKPAGLEITSGPLGPARAELLNAKASDSALILTQSVDRNGERCYLGKYVITGRAGAISFAQSG